MQTEVFGKMCMIEPLTMFVPQQPPPPIFQILEYVLRGTQRRKYEYESIRHKQQQQHTLVIAKEIFGTTECFTVAFVSVKKRPEKYLQRPKKGIEDLQEPRKTGEREKGAFDSAIQWKMCIATSKFLVFCYTSL